MKMSRNAFLVTLVLLGQLLEFAHATEYGGQPHYQECMTCTALLLDEEKFAATLRHETNLLSQNGRRYSHLYFDDPKRRANANITPPATGPPSI